MDYVVRILKRGIVIIIVVGMVCIVTLGLSLYIQSAPKAEFQWEVSVGDTYYYQLDFSLDYDDEYFEYDVEGLLELNNTVIVAKITRLPALEGPQDAASFTNNVLKYSKVRCSHFNGSNIISSYKDDIESALSGSFLPNGSWWAIDSLFPDENHVDGYVQYDESYATRLYSTYLQLEFDWAYGGYGEIWGGWTGTISLVTGIPTSISWYYYFYGTIYFQLTLVDAF